MAVVGDAPKFPAVKASAAIDYAETVWVQSRAQAQQTGGRVVTLLATSKTLDAETVVQITLLNNKGLQAAYADLGDAGADVWQSALIVNPTLSIGLIGIGTLGLQAYRAIEGTLAVNILASRPARRRLRSPRSGSRRRSYLLRSGLTVLKRVPICV